MLGLSRSFVQPVPTLVLAALIARMASASGDTIRWLEMEPTPFGESVPNGSVISVPGVGDVTITYSIPAQVVHLRQQASIFSDGTVVLGGDYFTWTACEIFGSDIPDGTIPLGPHPWTITYTFPNSLPSGALYLCVEGLGQTSSYGGGASTVTVDQNGTFLGDWSDGGNYGPTLFTPGVGTFQMQNSLTGAGGADPWWNTPLGIVRIDDAVSSLTVDVGQLRGDGIGLNIGFRCTSCVPAPPGMIAWWPLDETSGIVANELVSDLDGAYMGTPLPAPVSGVVESGLHFDPPSYVAAPLGAAPDVGAGDFSIDAWVRIEAPNLHTSLVSKGASFYSRFGLDDVGFDWGLWYANSDFDHQYLALGSGLDNQSFHFEFGPSSTFGWHHLAVTVDRSTAGVVFYRDGLPLPDASGMSPIAASLTTTHPLYLSKFGGETDHEEAMVGNLDEVEIFDRALTAAEVRALFEADASGKCKVRVLVPDVVFCPEDAPGAIATVPVTVINDSMTEQGISDLSCGPLPVGQGCSEPGPTILPFFPLGYVLQPGEQTTTNIQVVCPPNLGTACFRATAYGPDGECWFQDVTVRRAPCPPATYCRAKTSSLGCLPAIDASGLATLSGGDEYFVTANQIIGQTTGFLMWSFHRNPYGPLGNGLPIVGASPRGGRLCVQAPQVVGLQNSGGAPGTCDGTFSFHVSQSFMATNGFQAGDTVYAQWAYRDPAHPDGSGVGHTEALRFDVLP